MYMEYGLIAIQNLRNCYVNNVQRNFTINANIKKKLKPPPPKKKKFNPSPHCTGCPCIVYNESSVWGNMPFLYIHVLCI